MVSTTEKKPGKKTKINTGVKKPKTTKKNPKPKKPPTNTPTKVKPKKNQKVLEPKLTPALIKKMVLVELFCKKVTKGVYNPCCTFYTSNGKSRTDKEIKAITDACMEYASKIKISLVVDGNCIKFN